MMIRVGSGHDSHRLTPDRPLILAGVPIEFPLGLAGHSDADVVYHAVTDSVFGALADGDIGEHFPDTDLKFAGADSALFLARAVAKLSSAGWRVINLDVTVFAQAPKLTTYKLAMRSNLAQALCVDISAVSVKAKTGESVGPIGRGEAIACHAVVLISHEDD